MYVMPISHPYCRTNAGIVKRKPELVFQLVENFQRFSLSRLAIFQNDRAILSNGGTYHVWESLARTTEIYSFKFEGNSELATCLAVSPDGKVFVSGLRDGTICFWRNHGEMPLMSSAKGHTDFVESIAFSPTGERMVSGGGDGTVRIWDVSNGSEVGEPFEGSGWVLAVMFTHGGEHIVSLSGDQTIRVWDVATCSNIGEPLHLSGHLSGFIHCGAFSPDGKGAVVGTKNGEVMMWNLDDVQPVGKPCSPHESSVNSVAFSPDNEKIISASADGTIHISDRETQESECISHEDWVEDISLFPDGERAALVCENGKIGIWNIEPSWE